MDRAITLELRRKMPHETVDRLRHAEPELFDGLVSKLARFADDYRAVLRNAKPKLPESLHDRAQDNWEALLAIAEMAGETWLHRATQAALKLSGSANDANVSTGNELLSDIQHIFENKRADKISTADLITALCDDDEKSWATYNRGKPIVPRQLVKQLEPYRVKPKQVRLNSYDQVRGFEKSQFSDAFMRYLTPRFYPSQCHK